MLKHWKLSFILDLFSGEFELHAPFPFPIKGTLSPVDSRQLETKSIAWQLRLIYKEEIIEDLEWKIQSKWFEPSDLNLTELKVKLEQLVKYYIERKRSVIEDN